RGRKAGEGTEEERKEGVKRERRGRKPAEGAEKESKEGAEEELEGAEKERKGRKASYRGPALKRPAWPQKGRAAPQLPEDPPPAKLRPRQLKADVAPLTRDSPKIKPRAPRKTARRAVTAEHES
ncbi:hypothetical protein FKM82_029995, partial [Ascaphus truei]